MAQLLVEGHQYRTGKLDVFTQVNVMRRVAPVLSGLGLAMSKIGEATSNIVLNRMVGNGSAEKEEGEEEEQDTLFDAPDDNAINGIMFESLGPIADAISAMKDEDVEYVLKKCMAVCQRQENGKWVRVSAQNGLPMFADIEMMAMLTLAFAVIQENLGDFFPVRLQTNGESIEPSLNQSG